MSSQPLLLNITQAAELLGLTKPQLYELCRSRSLVRQAVPLPCVKLGKRLAFRRESLERWIEQLESTAAQPWRELAIETAVRTGGRHEEARLVRLNKGVKHEFSR